MSQLQISSNSELSSPWMGSPKKISFDDFGRCFASFCGKYQGLENFAPENNPVFSIEGGVIGVVKKNKSANYDVIVYNDDSRRAFKYSGLSFEEKSMPKIGQRIRSGEFLGLVKQGKLWNRGSFQITELSAKKGDERFGVLKYTIVKNIKSTLNLIEQNEDKVVSLKIDDKANVVGDFMMQQRVEIKKAIAVLKTPLGKSLARRAKTTNIVHKPSAQEVYQNSHAVAANSNNQISSGYILARA